MDRQAPSCKEIHHMWRATKEMSLGRPKHLRSAMPVRRYQWGQHSDMTHVNIEELNRFGRVGHRITGNWQFCLLNGDG